MYKILIFLILTLSIFSCSKEVIRDSSINEKNLDLQVIEAYKEGIKSLNEGDVLFAAKKFMRQKFYSPNQYGHQNQH